MFVVARFCYDSTQPGIDTTLARRIPITGRGGGESWHRRNPLPERVRLRSPCGSITGEEQNSSPKFPIGEFFLDRGGATRGIVPGENQVPGISPGCHSPGCSLASFSNASPVAFRSFLLAAFLSSAD